MTTLTTTELRRHLEAFSAGKVYLRDGALFIVSDNESTSLSITIPQWKRKTAFDGYVEARKTESEEFRQEHDTATQEISSRDKKMQQSFDRATKKFPGQTLIHVCGVMCGCIDNEGVNWIPIDRASPQQIADHIKASERSPYLYPPIDK